MALPEQQVFYTIDEYLGMERASGERHEYIDGFILLMSGESLAHSRICVNLAREVSTQLRGTPCEALSPNMKVRARIHANYKGRFSYPDLTVVCGRPMFHDTQKDVLLNPTVIFEVLSSSTESYDRGEKFLRYRTEIEMLTDYVLVSQDKPLIERYTRRTDGWLLTSVSSLGETLELPSINCRLSLSEVYDRVEFPEVEPEDSDEPDAEQ